MASASFRDSLNSLGWSRRDPDLPVNTNASTPFLSKIQSFNPFGSASSSVRLPTDESPGAPLPAPTRRQEEEAWFALSRWDRMLIFGALNLASLALFALCFAMFFFLLFKPTKFAILWTTASVFFLASWAVMMGPMVYARHLLSGPRLPFTGAYFGSIILTLVFAFKQYTILTMIAALFQFVALLWYMVSYFPMGSSGLRFAASIGSNRVAAWMNG